MMYESSGRRVWYRWYRAAAYVNALGALIWTAGMVLPFRPFSYAPPIMVSEAGEWSVMAYVLYITIGVCGFGWVSTTLHTIEEGEGRSVDSSLMLPGFVLFFAGVVLSCLVLAIGGFSGGYASTFNNVTGNSLKAILDPYVYPISALVLVAVGGAFLSILAMIRARGP